MRFPVPGFRGVIPRGEQVGAYRYKHPRYARFEQHCGIDLPAEGGSPIVRMRDESKVCEFDRGSAYGKQVAEWWVQRNKWGRKVYRIVAHAHCSSIRLHGPPFKGATIGAVGSTGMSTGDHDHLELYEVPVSTFAGTPDEWGTTQRYETWRAYHKNPLSLLERCKR